jgi:hypothetical protein
MIKDDAIEEIQCDAAPPIQNLEKNLVNIKHEVKHELYEKITPNGNKTDEKWEYYDKNENFLLRFGLIQIPGKEDLIRFEVLDTNKIPEDYEMFGEFFKRENLVQDLEITKKNIDVFTFILMLFESNPPEGEINQEKNEFKLIITKNDRKKYSFSLKNTACEDDNFFEKNIRKKIEQLEKKLENTCLILENENNELNNKNAELEKELNKIIISNQNLENENNIISKALQDLNKFQDKALLHLEQLKD